MIPNEVTIDLGALKHNFFEIKRLAGPHTGIIAVVKSDAYGHGMLPVARTLESAGVDCLGVFEVQEGIELRRQFDQKVKFAGSNNSERHKAVHFFNAGKRSLLKKFRAGQLERIKPLQS